MNAEQIIETLKTLARSQGSYGRFLEVLDADGLDYLVAQNFSGPVDLVMFLEG